MQYRNQDFLKTVVARSFKLGQLISRMMSRLPGQNLKEFFFFKLLPLANLDFENL